MPKRVQRKRANLEVNQFIGGLYTENNPMKTSPNVSHDELNMDMLRDGSRRRRLGFDYEASRSLIDSTVVYLPEKKIGTNIYKWENAGGDAIKALLVVQVGSSLTFFDLSNEPITSEIVHQVTYDVETYDIQFSFAVVDGILVAAVGDKEIHTFEYDSGTITESTESILIRDFFGVQAVIGGVDYTLAENLTKRPLTTNSAHTYNLRNQTFATPRYIGNVEVVTDTISGFRNSATWGSASGVSTANSYPSNADSVIPFLYPDANDAGDRLIERFFASNLIINPVGTTKSPNGYFIIDALERGASREAKEAELRVEYPENILSVTSLPQDKTPGGATVVNEYAGRVWFAGFSGNVEGGDRLSPRMSSYVLFSSLVRGKSDIGKCYQEADPTSNVDSALVDSDGGFIKLDDAYGIKSLVSVGGFQFVFAENGVWRISGTADDNFTATAYQTEKLTDRGCVSANSVVEVGDAIMYWSEDGIYLIKQAEAGYWDVTDTTNDKIKTFFVNIPFSEKINASGEFDSYEKTVRWVYTDVESDTSANNELVYNLLFDAYTPSVVNYLSGTFPKITNLSEGNPYNIESSSYTLTIEGVTVTIDGEPVTVGASTISSRVRENIYLIIDSVSSNVVFSLGRYYNTDFLDWYNEDSSGVNSDAYLQTSFITGGDTMSTKSVPYLHTFFKKTERGVDGLLEPIGQSSCLVSGRWDWSNNDNSKKWSTPRQAYRYNSVYIPDDITDVFDDGQTIISTKSRIRGSGSSVSFMLQSEAGRDMHVYGWSFPIEASED